MKDEDGEKMQLEKQTKQVDNKTTRETEDSMIILKFINSAKMGLTTSVRLYSYMSNCS